MTRPTSSVQGRVQGPRDVAGLEPGEGRLDRRRRRDRPPVHLGDEPHVDQTREQVDEVEVRAEPVAQLVARRADRHAAGEERDRLRPDLRHRDEIAGVDPADDVLVAVAPLLEVVQLHPGRGVQVQVVDGHAHTGQSGRRASAGGAQGPDRSRSGAARSTV